MAKPEKRYKAIGCTAPEEKSWSRLEHYSNGDCNEINTSDCCRECNRLCNHIGRKCGLSGKAGSHRRALCSWWSCRCGCTQDRAKAHRADRGLVLCREQARRNRHYRDATVGPLGSGRLQYSSTRQYILNTAL